MNFFPFIESRYRFRCGFCAAVFETDYQIHSVAVPPVPVIPEGWQRLNDSFICSAHEVDLRPDYTLKQKGHQIGRAT